MNLNGIKITWLGHATFLVDTPGGKKIIIDPWVTSNPSTPADKKKIDKLDVMLCTHGHSDHIGDAVNLARKLDPKVVGIFEFCSWINKRGAKHIAPMNKGGTQRSEEHTSELQSRFELVCRLLLEKQKATASPGIQRTWSAR